MTEADNVKGTEFYQSFAKTLQKKEKDGLEPQEAEEAAWIERQCQLRCFLETHEDEIDELMNTTSID